ncbi:MAG: zinc ribbon domain-containing protein, partial [Anaerolineae bacterium]
MSKEIICTNCQTANAPGSKFCNNCGERLPLSTSLICPNCGTSNPRNRFYCDNCGTRLVQDTPKPEEPEEVRPPGETGDLDPLQIVPDWLEQQNKEDADEEVPRQHMPKIEEVGPPKKVTDDLPDWLVDEHDPESIIGSPRVITTEHYMNLMREPKEDVPDDLGDTDEQAQLPDWLSGITPPPGSEQATQSDDRSTPDDALSEWLASISGEEPQEEAAPPTPEEPAPSEPSSDFFAELNPPEETAEEQTGWLIGDEDELEDESAVEPRIETDSLAGLEAEDQAMGSEMFDWLSENLSETGPLAEQSLPEEEAGIDLDDWLADFSDQDAAEESPDWAAELTGTDDEEEFESVDTDVLAGITDAVAQQDMNKPDEALPGWMAELADQEDEETAVSDAEPLPDWMSEFTTADTDQFEEEISARLETAADDLTQEDNSWLDDLSAAAPDEEAQPPAVEPAASLPQAEPTETGPLPDWLTGDGGDESLLAEEGADDSLFADLFAPGEAAEDTLDWFS